jgi:hypothetical protein
VPEFILGASKHNLLCSLEHEFAFIKLSFDLQPHSSASGILRGGFHFVVGGKVTAVYLSVKQYVVCNKMSYGDKGRHRLWMMVIIRENLLLFAVRAVATGLLIAE